MPAKSKAQQKAAGAALSAKRGDTPKAKLRGASREMYDSMSEDQLEEFAETKRKGLPTRKATKKSATKSSRAGKSKTPTRKASTAKRKASAKSKRAAKS